MEKDFRILYIEDDRGDVDLLQYAINMIPGNRCHLSVIEDGEKAMTFIEQRDKNPQESPNLILLDLNLPRVHGRDVLLKLKGSAELCRIPVIVLTTSARQEDVDFCYEAGANAYIKKAIGFKEYQETVRRLIDFWAGTAVLPSPLRTSNPR